MFSLRLTRKIEYEAEESERVKAEHGANIDSPDLPSGFCLKKLRKWKSRASDTNQRRRKQSHLRKLMCRQRSSELDDVIEKIYHEKGALQGGLMLKHTVSGEAQLLLVQKLPLNAW